MRIIKGYSEYNSISCVSAAIGLGEVFQLFHTSYNQAGQI